MSSSSAILWTVTVMGCLWAPLCHFTWRVEVEEDQKKRGSVYKDNSEGEAE